MPACAGVPSYSISSWMDCRDCRTCNPPAVVRYLYIGKDFYSTDNEALSVSQRCDAHADRYAMSRLVAKVDLSFTALSITNRGRQRTVVHAKSATTFINVLQEVVEALSANRIRGCISG